MQLSALTIRQTEDRGDTRRQGATPGKETVVPDRIVGTASRSRVTHAKSAAVYASYDSPLVP